MNQYEQLAIAKINMLHALSRSQSAVAQILEHTANAACEYKLPVALIGEQLQVIANYQSSLLAQISGLMPRYPKLGNPKERPWLNDKLTPSIGEAARHASIHRQIRRGE